MIDHNVVWFHVTYSVSESNMVRLEAGSPVHYPSAVTEIECFQELIDVVPDDRQNVALNHLAVPKPRTVRPCR